MPKYLDERSIKKDLCNVRLQSQKKNTRGGILEDGVDHCWTNEFAPVDYQYVCEATTQTGTVKVPMSLCLTEYRLLGGQKSMIDDYHHVNCTGVTLTGNRSIGPCKFRIKVGREEII